MNKKHPLIKVCSHAGCKNIGLPLEHTVGTTWEWQKPPPCFKLNAGVDVIVTTCPEHAGKPYNN